MKEKKRPFVLSNPLADHYNPSRQHEKHVPMASQMPRQSLHCHGRAFKLASGTVGQG